MKIGEFAQRNQVTPKMLRHYDDIGLLKPSAIDPETGYRSYRPEQSHLLNWIIILKNLDFSLGEIKDILSNHVDSENFLRQLTQKRIEITSALNKQIQKKIAIDRLITMIKKEGFDMGKHIDLLNIEQADVHEIKKNIPNMEMFLDETMNIAAACSQDDSIAVFRYDISHFKQINDDYGFEIGDRVIAACFRIIESNVQPRLAQAAYGRAHGDEFVVFAKTDKDTLQETAQAIVETMKQYDFHQIGCPKQMKCYIGGLVTPYTKEINIRNLIEESIEIIDHARSLGPNSIMIEDYP